MVKCGPSKPDWELFPSLKSTTKASGFIIEYCCLIVCSTPWWIGLSQLVSFNKYETLSFVEEDYRARILYSLFLTQ